QEGSEPRIPDKPLETNHPETTHLTATCSCEDCSAFTRVAARTLARSPICDQLHRRLQPFRYLHDCSGCFRLERLPGGACTHWKAPPCHGAHVERTFRVSLRMGILWSCGAGQKASLVVVGQIAEAARPVMFVFGT